MSAHFQGFAGEHMPRTQLWQGPCGSLFFDDLLNPDWPPECNCDHCGGAVMTLVGEVSAADVVNLAKRKAVR